MRDGEEDLDEVITRQQQRSQGRDDQRMPRSAGWTGMVLYGDPTPTVMQRLSPADPRTDDEDTATGDQLDEMGA